MPHKDNSHWMSMLLGRPVSAPRRFSVADLVASREFFDFSHLNTDLPEMAEVHEVLIWEREAFHLTAEIYVPQGEGPFLPFLFLHGGGWYSGGAADCRKLAMRVAEQGYVVCNLNYSAAPERPFPAAVEDCVYAARWIARNIESYNAIGRPLAIGGESSGANLAAATIVALQTEPGQGSGLLEGLEQGELADVAVDFLAALFLYGTFDFSLRFSEPGSDAGSIELRAVAYLSPNFLLHFWNPLVSPIHAPNLAGFPPSYLACGDEDSLVVQSLAMTKALAQANVPVTLSVIEGADHAFAHLEHILPSVGPELQRIFTWLRIHARAGTEVRST